MTNEVVNFDPSKFEASVANVKKGAASRVEFLKMSKAGEWTYGADDIDLDENDELYVDPMGFVHGWQCWADTDIAGVQAELLGNVVVPAHEPLPMRPADVPKNGRQWSELRGMSAVMGEHKLTYTTTSLGGVQFIAALGQALAKQWATDKTRMIPVITLGNDWYKHKKYGKMYVPMFEVLRWVAAVPTAAPPAPTPEPPKAIKRTRKTAAQPA